MESASVIIHCEPRQTVHIDDAGVCELSLNIIRKVAAHKKFAAKCRSHAFVVEDKIQPRAASELGSGQGGIPSMIRRRTVTDDALPPVIEDITPHVVLTGQRKLTNFQRARIQHIRTTGTPAAMRAPRCFKSRAGCDPFQHVQLTRVTPFKRTAGVVRIVRCPAVEQMHNFVGLVVAVRVFQEQQTRLIDDENPAVPKFKTGRAVQLVVKDFAGICFAIVIDVFQNQQPIVRFVIARFPLRICGHAGNPQASFVVEV